MSTMYEPQEPEPSGGKGMKSVTYTLLDGTKKTIEYDETAPCVVCGEPVLEASMGGTVVCPWCDCGNCRFCGGKLPIFEGQIKSHVASCKLLRKGRDEGLPQVQ